MKPKPSCELSICKSIMVLLLTSIVIVHSLYFVPKCYESKRSIPSLQKAIKVYPSNDTAKLKLADLYAYTGVRKNLFEAERMLLEVYEGRPYDPHLLVNLAKVIWVDVYRWNNRAEAMSYVRKAQELYPDFEHAEILRKDLTWCINANRCYRLLPESFY